MSGHTPNAGIGKHALGHHLGFVLCKHRNRHSLMDAEKACVGRMLSSS